MRKVTKADTDPPTQNTSRRLDKDFGIKLIIDSSDQIANGKGKAKYSILEKGIFFTLIKIKPAMARLAPSI